MSRRWRIRSRDPAFPTLSFGFVGDIHFYPDFFRDAVVGDEVPGSDTKKELSDKARKERTDHNS